MRTRGGVAFLQKRDVVFCTCEYGEHTSLIVSQRPVHSDSVDEMVEHVVVACLRIFPTARTLSLSVALGFKTPEETDNTSNAIATTKRRLEFWWQHGAMQQSDRV